MKDWNNFDNTFNTLDRDYLRMLMHVMQHGRRKKNRTGIDTLSVFDYTIRHDMRNGFPLITTKNVWFKGVLTELMWFLTGNENIRYLLEQNVHIWDEWPYERYCRHNEPHLKNGRVTRLTRDEFCKSILEDDDFANSYGMVGKIYGAQWKNWTSELDTEGIDQLSEVIRLLKTDPDSRRIIVTAWNPSEVLDSVLPPCHCFFQFYSEPISGDEIPSEYISKFGNIGGMIPRRLSVKCIMRSVDLGLGFCWDIATYGLLLLMVSDMTDHVPGDVVMSLNDAHIYVNHLGGLVEQMRNNGDLLPTVKLLNLKYDSIYDYKYEDFELVGYRPDGKIKLDIAV